MGNQMLYPVPRNERERLLSVLNYGILDTSNEEELDQLTSLTAHIFNVPIALITIIDEKRQWFKSNYGLSIKETERSLSFCQYTIMGDELFEVPNAMEDERFIDNLLVTKDPNIRFYCGAPLKNEEGFRMGSLAIIDRVPRKLTEQEKKVLKLLAKQVINFFELHSKRKDLEKDKATLEKRVQERTQELEAKMVELKRRDLKLKVLNNEMNHFIYKASHDLIGPLKTMQGLTNLALKEVTDDNIRDYLQLLYNTEKKLDNTLGSLLKVVVIKDISDISDVNWENIIEEAFEDAVKRSGKKNYEHQVKINGHDHFKSDRILLCMLLEEIFLNGIQYNQSERIRISTVVEQIGRNVTISITDNGIGIRNEEKDKVFEMFYKSLFSSGSGLGLYIVNKAVEKLKGDVSFISTKNKGTTFQVNLPSHE